VPDRQDEFDRIQKAGGQVLKVKNTYRVDGVLSVTRAIGDKDFKSSGVISEPEIKSLKIDHQDELMILATDGLFNTMSK
jgi:serine/threonine protein phosphatase PrpC